jgi:hypothetical protein
MAVLVLALTAGAVAGCASAAPSAPPAARPAIPPEFRDACGHPGANVEVRKVPVTISHAACDLTGVAISTGTAAGRPSRTAAAGPVSATATASS